MNIFTYGTLMFDQVWTRVTENVYDRTEARVYGYRRRRVRNASYPALVPGSERDYVSGKIYLGVCDSDIKKLDRFEGEYYQKKRVECELPDGSMITVCAYVFKKQYLCLLEDAEWDSDQFANEELLFF